MIRKLFIVVIVIMPLFVLANTPNSPEKEGVVKGKIYDEKSKNPVEYATVAVYRTDDDSVVTGTITNDDGEFKIKGLKPGTFYIIVSFLGYDDKRYDDVRIEYGRDIIDLGDINLGAASTSLSEVEVVSNRQTVEYHIDKKVVSVGKQMTSASMSAIEVLENVPSIRVDIEGNVALRGSTGFTVLIDGKPTVLEPSDVLRQTPASTIQNIEIITNPSAKYQPDGTGGIINIITKKNRMQGLQGLFNLKAGSFGMYGSDFMLNYRKKKVNINFGADYNDRPFPGTSYNERHTTSEGVQTIIKAEGDSERAYVGGSIRGGIDWDITERDLFTFGFRLGDYNMNSNSQLDYRTVKAPDNGDGVIRELSLNESGRGGQYYSLTSNYTHKFAAKGHELAAQLNYRFREGTESSMNVLKDASQIINDGSKTTENGPSGRWELRLDYVKPIGEADRFEAGFQGRRSESKDATEFYTWDTDGNDFVIHPEYSNNTDYERNIMGLYSLYNGKIEDFGYQIGIRGEYTFREINTVRDNESFNLDRWDYFPTIHLSYQLPKENQVMASYSRRIDRPRGYYLEPFITWQDMYNVRQGNPDLLPEYIDALDIGYLKQWEKSQLSLEGYYRVTHNKVERIQSVYEPVDPLPGQPTEGVILHSVANVGTDYSLGAEAMFNLPLFKWWETNLMGNIYDYRIKGIKYDEPFERSSFNWSARINNTFRIRKNMQIQLDSSYDSPTVTAQGETKGYYAFNGAYRVDLFDRKFSAVMQVRDVFATTKRIRISEDVNFYDYSESQRRAPVFSFTLSYRLNNFKSKRGNRNGGEGMDDEL